MAYGSIVKKFGPLNKVIKIPHLIVSNSSQQIYSTHARIQFEQPFTVTQRGDIDFVLTTAYTHTPH